MRGVGGSTIAELSLAAGIGRGARHLDGVRQQLRRSRALLSCGKRQEAGFAAAATSEATSFVLAGWAAELHPAARGLRGAQRGVADAPPLRRDR